MKDFYSCKIRKIRHETDDCVSIYLDIPEEVKKKFSYLPGQYLTLQVTINEKEIRRSYSLSTAPYEGQWRVAIKQLENGIFSTFANQELRVGDTIKVMPPQGNFLLKEPNDKNTYVFFAAGSGITPIISMIKHLLFTTDKNVVLFYGNKTTDQIIYREEIEGLKNNNIDRFSVHYILSQEKLGSPLFCGRINREKCISYQEKLLNHRQIAQYLICGPSDMIFEIEAALVEKGVDKNAIKYELFTTNDLPAHNRKSTTEKSTSTTGQVAQVDFIVDGLRTQIMVPYEGLSLLDTAIEAGVDLPFSCKGGVCSTCKAKLQEGKVYMDVNYALEEEEVTDGYILTCQSHPQSQKLIVDFDDY